MLCYILIYLYLCSRKYVDQQNRPQFSLQTRKMRSDQYVMLPRMASFIATTNDYQPLTDPTGSRRYLCCELTGIIDTDTPIPYKQLYAQAIHELEQGHP